MLQACSPSHDWFCDSEPLLFDDEFCLSLMKDLQSIPTPPQSPPMKAGLAKSLSTVDQLELVSELLIEDSDFLQLDWNFTGSASAVDSDPLSEDYLWQSDKPNEDKLSAVLSTSPLLSDIDTEILPKSPALRWTATMCARLSGFGERGFTAGHPGADRVHVWLWLTVHWRRIINSDSGESFD